MLQKKRDSARAVVLLCGNHAMGAHCALHHARQKKKLISKIEGSLTFFKHHRQLLREVNH